LSQKNPFYFYIFSAPNSELLRLFELNVSTVTFCMSSGV